MIFYFKMVVLRYERVEFMYFICLVEKKMDKILCWVLKVRDVSMIFGYRIYIIRRMVVFGVLIWKEDVKGISFFFI